jgi:hypothetical protein
MTLAVGTVVIPQACIEAGTAVILGTVAGIGEGTSSDVLWEDGQLVQDVADSELHVFWSVGDPAITHTYRPACRAAAAGGATAPGPDCVGVEVAHTATESVIRTLAGHRYHLYTSQLRYLDE